MRLLSGCAPSPCSGPAHLPHLTFLFLFSAQQRHSLTDGHRGFSDAADRRDWRASKADPVLGQWTREGNLHFLIIHNGSHMPAVDDARGALLMFQDFLGLGTLPSLPAAGAAEADPPAAPPTASPMVETTRAAAASITTTEVGPTDAAGKAAAGEPPAAPAEARGGGGGTLMLVVLLPTLLVVTAVGGFLYSRTRMGRRHLQALRERTERLVSQRPPGAVWHELQPGGGGGGGGGG